MSLGDLTFSDLFVAAQPQTSWYKPTPDSLSVVAVPQDCHQELMDLRAFLMSRKGETSFKVRWPQQNAQFMRVERIVTGTDEEIFCLRVYRLAPAGLANLGMPPVMATRLMDPELQSGLVVFFGRSGAGKTTTASSYMVERIKSFGGVGWTVESPIELTLQGQHGKGWCYQTEVEHNEEIGPAIRRLMRATPNVILIGELLDGRAVVEAITAALSGHLVVTTFHAGDLVSGILRLCSLAQSIDKDMTDALANALAVGMHLSLHNYDPAAPKRFGGAEEAKGTGTPPRVLSVEALWLAKHGEAARSMIRDGEVKLLVSEIERQKRGAMMRSLP